MVDSTYALEMLEQIRTLGVRITIDDFGTGFSSMSYITRFAIDRIKMDQSFLRNVTQDHNSRTVATPTSGKKTSPRQVIINDTLRTSPRGITDFAFQRRLWLVGRFFVL